MGNQNKRMNMFDFSDSIDLRMIIFYYVHIYIYIYMCVIVCVCPITGSTNHGHKPPLPCIYHSYVCYYRWSFDDLPIYIIYIYIYNYIYIYITIYIYNYIYTYITIYISIIQLYTFILFQSSQRHGFTAGWTKAPLRSPGANSASSAESLARTGTRPQWRVVLKWGSNGDRQWDSSANYEFHICIYFIHLYVCIYNYIYIYHDMCIYCLYIYIKLVPPPS